MNQLMPLTLRLSAAVTLGVATATLLSGCLIPEKFTAAVDVKPDGSATYQYDGTAKNFLVALQMQEAGPLSAKDEADLRQDAEKTAKKPGVRKFEYLGAGRYQMLTVEALQPGHKPAMLDMVRLTKGKDGVFSLASPPIKEKDQQELKKISIKIDGTLEVKLPSNAKVVAHNASSTPGFFSKAYVWKIGGADLKPSITYTLSPS